MSLFKPESRPASHQTVDAAGLSAAAPVASTSTSQKKHKDWSQAADAALTASTDPSAVGPCPSLAPCAGPLTARFVVCSMQKDEGDVNDFFKKLYADLDDDGRKAMMKSMSESNGELPSFVLISFLLFEFG